MDERVLQIDHVNGGGSGRARRLTGTTTRYKEVITNAPSGRFQLLCANCNWIKRFERKEVRGGLAEREGTRLESGDQA